MYMKSLLPIVIAALVAFITVQFTASSSQVNTESEITPLERVKNSGVLRCAYVSVNPDIYLDLKTGELKGPIKDIVEAMAKEAGLEVEWTEEVTYADFTAGFKTNRYDAFCGIMAATPQRAREVIFLRPYTYEPYYVFVRQDEDRFLSWGDLNNPQYKSGVIDGEVFQAMGRKEFPDAQEVSLPSITGGEQLLVDLANRKVDFSINSLARFDQYKKNNPNKIKILFDELLIAYPTSFAVSEHAFGLEKLLSQSITYLLNSGAIEDILVKHGADHHKLLPDLDYQPQ